MIARLLFIWCLPRTTFLTSSCLDDEWCLYTFYICHSFYIIDLSWKTNFHPINWVIFPVFFALAVKHCPVLSLDYSISMKHFSTGWNYKISQYIIEMFTCGRKTFPHLQFFPVHRQPWDKKNICNVNGSRAFRLWLIVLDTIKFRNKTRAQGWVLISSKGCQS